MERLPKFVVSRLAQRQQQTADHPEADVLAAFAEGRLSPRERTVVVGHLAQCPVCRQVMSLSSVDNGSDVNPVSSNTRGWVFSWRWRWAAAVAAACLVTAVVWRPEFFRNNQQHPPAPIPTVTPAPQTDISPAPTLPEAHKQKTVAPKEAALPSRKVSPKAAAQAENRMVKPEVLRGAVPEAIPALQRAAPRLNLPSAEQARSFTVSPISPQLSQGGMMRRSPEESLWKLPEGREGALERSQDGGKTWQSVRVEDGSRLYALSAAGPEIWAGGAEGALFHSVDNGSHWTPVIVAGDGKRLRNAITRIDVRDGKTVHLKVQGGGSWVTVDGGEHWRPEL